MILKNLALLQIFGGWDLKISFIAGTRIKNKRNIVIEGRGNVILDGGEHNGLSERNCGRDGRPEIYVNNIILFGGVHGCADKQPPSEHTLRII